ncbi:MAG TPA: YciI family protein [Terriglobales bacterium]|jgi:hypothetical protein|nr:YciI family protein [Terriglobales bacterium]
MKYILLAYIEKGKFEGMTEDEQHAMFDECFEYDDHLRTNGHFAAEAALQPPETALTLYWKNGKVATTDGPFAETREQLGGFFVLEARDMNHAVQLMAQHPALKYGSIFEIRPAADLTEMVKASEQRRRRNTAATPDRELGKKPMKRKKMHSILLGASMLVAALSAPWPAAAQDAKQPYATMARVEEYLMDRNAEIALARSAAPDAVSRDATFLILDRHGYETAVEGKNGWVCMVERGWMATFDSPEFWNPKVRGANCLNPPAARSMLPLAYKRTELLLAGHSKIEVMAAIKVALDKKELPALEPGTVCYMMSKLSYLSDNDGHNGPHLMFYEPVKDDAAWGANISNSPVVSVNYWYLSAQAYPQLESFPAIRVFAVVVHKWSDGTPAPSM